MQSLYGATPYFPLVGSESATALDQEAQQLSSDLIAAGLSGLAPLALGTDILTPETFHLLPAAPGSGIEAAPLQTGRYLYGAGDLELSARVRLLDNLTPEWSTETTYPADRQAAHARRPWLQYRLTASFLTRLPTGQNEDPDILLDVGRSDAQFDIEGGATLELRFGRKFGVTTGGRYGSQGSTTLTKRVAPPELAMPPVSTRREVTFDPGFYVIFGAAPVFHVTDGLTLHGEYRFFHKGRDQFELVSADPSLDATVLEIESGMKMHQAGGGAALRHGFALAGGCRRVPPRGPHPAPPHLRRKRGPHAPGHTRRSRPANLPQVLGTRPLGRSSTGRRRGGGLPSRCPQQLARVLPRRGGVRIAAEHAGDLFHTGVPGEAVRPGGRTTLPRALLHEQNGRRPVKRPAEGG